MVDLSEEAVARSALVSGNDLTETLLNELTLSRNLRFVVRSNWATEKTRWPNDDDVVLAWTWQANQYAVLELGYGFVRVEIGGGRVSVSAAASTMAQADAAIERVRHHLPETAPDEGMAQITFWTYGPHGAQERTRLVEVPAWDAIRGNYTWAVVDEIDRLTGDEFRPAFGGQLMLWQGEPGTGKTYALRSLVWEWRGWADFHYIVDPEHFFGSKSDYMLDVLLSETDGIRPSAMDDEPEETELAPPKWKVLILEDTGELLSADAKERAGQALSRLLNVVDGIIGQGLRVLVLVTTNEEVKALHPAVARPGRCASQIAFEDMTQDERNEWLARHGIESRSQGGSLADLYALVEERAGRKVAKSMGFG